MNQTNTTISNEEIMEFLKKFYNEFLTLKTKVSSVSNQVSSLETSVSSLETSVSSLKNEFSSFKQEMQSFKLQTENKFINIENKLSIHSEKFEILNTKLNSQTLILEKQEASIKEIWQDRKEMKLGLTKPLLIVTGVLSGAIAIVVSFFTGKAITYSIK